MVYAGNSFSRAQPVWTETSVQNTNTTSGMSHEFHVYNTYVNIFETDIYLDYSVI